MSTEDLFSQSITSGSRHKNDLFEIKKLKYVLLKLVSRSGLMTICLVLTIYMFRSLSTMEVP